MNSNQALSRIEITENIDEDGELIYSFQLSEGMTFPDAVKLLEMAKLSLYDIYQAGEWEE